MFYFKLKYPLFKKENHTIENIFNIVFLKFDNVGSEPCHEPNSKVNFLLFWSLNWSSSFIELLNKSLDFRRTRSSIVEEASSLLAEA